ncbi:MAG TPA: YeeE/YedE family protein [Burkholderiales bacterium]|jgi:hypothetical protein
MTIDWAHFTPWTSLAGGLLIGVAVAMFVLLNGRVAGISGIVGGLVKGLISPRSGEIGWRFAFIGGLLIAPALMRLLGTSVVPRIDASFPTLVAAGLAVGIGTSYGSGCTSGHGVCGISRLSPRSLAATAAFMLAGMATVFLWRSLA